MLASVSSTAGSTEAETTMLGVQLPVRTQKKLSLVSCSKHSWGPALLMANGPLCMDGARVPNLTRADVPKSLGIYNSVHSILCAFSITIVGSYIIYKLKNKHSCRGSKGMGFAFCTSWKVLPF